MIKGRDLLHTMLDKLLDARRAGENINTVESVAKQNDGSAYRVTITLHVNKLPAPGDTRLAPGKNKNVS